MLKVTLPKMVFAELLRTSEKLPVTQESMMLDIKDLPKPAIQSVYQCFPLQLGLMLAQNDWFDESIYLR